MYIKVVYYNEKLKGYSGRGYTYKTDLELKEGDKVLVPVGNDQEGKRALVVETDVPDSEIDPAWADRIKAVTQYDYTDMSEVQ